jgi:DNA/RNA endonuclease G (NUC1)
MEQSFLVPNEPIDSFSTIEQFQVSLEELEEKSGIIFPR